MLRSELYHPLLIHFPITLLVIPFYFYFSSFFSDKSFELIKKPLNWLQLSFFLGLGLYAFSLFTGDIALEVAQTRNHKLLPIYDHENYAYYGLYSFILFSILDHGLKIKKLYSKKTLILSFLVYSLSLYFLIKTAHLGALLVYDHGIGIFNQ
jgi:uncharacterized membrane protein